MGARCASLGAVIDQIAYWNGAAGQRWVDEQRILDEDLRPYGEAAMTAAALRAGESVLDVGCGCGATTAALAERVGTAGRVLGVDVSAPMLSRARYVCAAIPNVSLREGDAATTELGAETFDLAFSRFGVMFFTDPIAAFANVARALRPGGRLAFSCWGPLADNTWATAPNEVVIPIVGAPERQPPDAPGPFAFADLARLREILTRAGFSDVALQPFRGVMTFGRGGSVEETAAEIARVGPVARLLVDRDDSTRTRALEALRRWLPPYLDADGRATFSAVATIATARRSPVRASRS